MSDLRLVVFDVDGTLVDSQADILAAMKIAFDEAELSAPTQSEVLAIVGLSLHVAMPRLAPDAGINAHLFLEEAYKRAYMALRAEQGAAKSSPLYPGAREVLDHLHGVPEILLGVATGKSRRGLDKLLKGHALQNLFVTEQVADFHPSKPHPSMLQTALKETVVMADRAVMVGDTSYDMDMARAAGIAAIGVSWGYHSIQAMTAADIVIDSFEALPQALDEIWEK